MLGGIRSGKSAFAEALVADAPSVRYIATAAGAQDDPEWIARIEAHQRRRPQTWSTEETGADPARLAALLSDAKPAETLLVDDLGGWVTALLDPALQPQDDEAGVAELADAVHACAARLVLVSPEVGLSLVPMTPVGRAFADALGTANQALAQACERVALVVAGRPIWLTPDAGRPVADVLTAPAEPEITPADSIEPGYAVPKTAEPEITHADSVEPGYAGPNMAQPEITHADSVEPGYAVSDMAAPAPGAGPQQARQPGTPAPPPPPAADAEPRQKTTAERTPVDVFSAPTMMLPLVSSGVVIQPGMDLPLPDNDAGPDARDRLATLDFAGTGLGALGEAIEFAAGTQGTAVPRPWAAVRVLLVSGDHAGGAAAGTDPGDAARRLAGIESGHEPLAWLAGEAGADVEIVRVVASGAMEDGPVLAVETVDRLLRQGWSLADQAADDGRDALVLGSCGTGTDAAATAVLAATTGAEPVAVLPRVLAPGGFYDDAAWMIRCAAVRDALHRIRQESRGARDILAQIGGADLAVATGALLGAAARRLPVLLDGPVGIAAALVARDLAGQARHWCLLPDAGKLALVAQGADVLGLTPVLDLGLGLGEGANALAALPLLRIGIALAATLSVHPGLLSNPDDGALSDGNPSDGNPNDGNPDDGGPNDGGPNDGNPNGGGPNGGNPSDGGPNGGNPSDGGLSGGNPGDGGLSDRLGGLSDRLDGDLVGANDGEQDVAEPERYRPGPAGADV
ncbi:MAG: nicotinate-nucleotide--dimethylbenzimidazole phosphoribosyltransferase [Actinoplanes sp.]|nr:nicotinate-nucleotide--dimethylbenzimidazole phosphoribosyltransferase [Actinoplanes sp.]